jgi:dienelactone hydrolase
MKHFLLSILLLFASWANAQTLVKIDNQGVQLDGYFYAVKADDARKAPTILALHGCGGMLNPSGRPNLRTAAYSKFLNEQGWHVLFLDSFTARGVKSVCGSGGNVPPSLRVTDVQAAVAYLAKREEVDVQRIGILGWSHGGSTTLLANEKNVQYAVAPRAALAFYPGCGDGNKGGAMFWQPARPILMQLGASDDWTNPITCQRLTALHPELVQQDTYANANHGFDSDGAVRPVLLKTPRGNKTVHAGGEPAAKAASQAKLIAFFKGHFK